MHKIPKLKLDQQALVHLYTVSHKKRATYLLQNVLFQAQNAPCPKLTGEVPQIS